MNFSTFLFTSFFALRLVLAQYGSPASSDSSSSSTSSLSATKTSSSSTSTHTIAVGASGLAFSPNSLTAGSGDTLEFHFYAPVHSVAQGSFSSPCSPLSNTSFFSGGITTSSGQNTNVFTVLVNDTQPIWFYCGVPTHCEAGMVGVVNAPSDGSQTLAQYQSAAAGVSKSSVPSQAQGGVLGPVKALSSNSSSSTSGSATSSATSSAASSAGATGSTSKPSAGNQAREDVKWIHIVLVCIFSVGIGSLMV